MLFSDLKVFELRLKVQEVNVKVWLPMLKRVISFLLQVGDQKIKARVVRLNTFNLR